SLNGECNLLYVRQEGEDAIGLNLSFLLRYHFVKLDRFTVYVDLGAGLLGTTQRVPQATVDEPRGGAKFNFTPQPGGGFTYCVRPNVHLMAGVRWFHISDARITPNNPGRDSAELYVGLAVPF